MLCVLWCRNVRWGWLGIMRVLWCRNVLWGWCGLMRDLWCRNVLWGWCGIMHVLSREHQFTEWQHVCESVYFHRLRCGYHGTCRLVHIVRCRQVQGEQRERRVHGLCVRQVFGDGGLEYSVNVPELWCRNVL